MKILVQKRLKKGQLLGSGTVLNILFYINWASKYLFSEKYSDTFLTLIRFPDHLYFSYSIEVSKK